MLTIVAFIVTIGLLVTIHEYGHYQVARWCGVRVLRFSVGFGKPLWQRTISQDKTELVLAAIPLGGYVKMLDERELKADREQGKPVENYSEQDLKRAFNRQSVWKRIAIVIAGPLANLLLAIGLYWLLFMQGVVGIKPLIGEVASGSLAQQANFVPGELIVRIAGKPVETWQDARWLLLEKSMGDNPVEVETQIGKHQRHVHTLHFADMTDDPERDILDKLGLKAYQPKIAPIIGEVLPGGAAEKAGLRVGDVLEEVDGMPMEFWDEVVSSIQANPGKTISIVFKRGEKTTRARVKPEAVGPTGAQIGQIGAAVKIEQTVQQAIQTEMHYTPLQALFQAATRTWQTSVFSLTMLKNMLIGKASIKTISGPISIASYAGESAHMGWKVFAGFLALVSISIGVLNLLPIPVLDGGHLMYYMAELLKGRPISEQTMLVGQKIGMSVLGLMMTIAIFNDLTRLFTG